MLAGPDHQPTPRLEVGPVRPPRRRRWPIVGIVILAGLLAGLPLGYRVVLNRSSGSSLPVTASPAGVRSSPSDPPGPVSTGLSTVDLALERLGVTDLFGNPLDRDCSVEHIRRTSDRSVRLGGQVEARDHAGWVFTCRNETGERSRYFQFTSNVNDVLTRIGAWYRGSLTYVGAPGGTLETRWWVAGSALSGEIEMVTVAGAPDTLTILLLIDLRGSWQGEPPSP